jgi:acyl carrier protein
LGLHAVTISLPFVDGIGYAAEADVKFQDALYQNAGLTLAEQHFYTTFKGAIMGPASGLNANGSSVVGAVRPTDVTRPWERFSTLAAWRSATVSDSEQGASKQSRNKTSSLVADVRSSSEPLECLQGALKDKVSVMTMINRDDILIDRNIEDYGLDSLVSVELRNWIRREFGAELALTAIVGSGNLKGLSEKILSLMPAKA